MVTKLKTILNNPQLWQVLATALLGYFGYTEVEQRRSVEPPVIPQITVSKPVLEPISCKCIDYAPRIVKAVRESERRHLNGFHGGG